MSGTSAPTEGYVFDATALPDALRGSVIAIGNFDGLHRGHQAVIAEALAIGAALHAPTLVLSFDPHPRTLFRPDAPMFRLTPDPVKAQVLKALGVAGLVNARFDRAFAGQTAEEFISGVLVAQLGARHVVVGHDFRFGRGQSGNTDFLVATGPAAGVGVTVVEAFSDEGGAIVSSSRIRDLLRAGDTIEAAGLLGYRFLFAAPVIHGDARGRDLGYPTANLDPGGQFGLAHGIYAVRVRVEGKLHDGVASFGRRPTFDNGNPLFEVHLFDFAGDLYGRWMDVSVICRLRGEERFDSIDALIAQMDRDSAEARAALGAIVPLGALDLALTFAPDVV